MGPTGLSAMRPHGCTTSCGLVSGYSRVLYAVLSGTLCRTLGHSVPCSRALCAVLSGTLCRSTGYSMPYSRVLCAVLSGTLCRALGVLYPVLSGYSMPYSRVLYAVLSGTLCRVLGYSVPYSGGTLCRTVKYSRGTYSTERCRAFRGTQGHTLRRDRGCATAADLCAETNRRGTEGVLFWGAQLLLPAHELRDLGEGRAQLLRQLLGPDLRVLILLEYPGVSPRGSPW